jgi:hypothetical protein
MKTRRSLAAAALGSLMAFATLHAQTLPTKYQMTLSVVCWTTNNSGQIIQQNFGNQTVLRQAANANGVTDFSNWVLAYHLGGNELGDTIEIIDRNTGHTLQTLFGLYFGEDFGRQALLSASTRQLKRIEYVYTDQNSHSLGSALLTQYNYFDNMGHTNKIYVIGQMQYVVTQDAKHPRTQICTANFTTMKPWNFNSGQ